MGYPNRRGPGRGRVVEIELAPGQRSDRGRGAARAAGALAEPPLFVLHARLRGAVPRLRTGTVLDYDSMSPRELLRASRAGFGSAQLRVVIPEGFSRFEIATRLARWGVCERAAFLAATHRPRAAAASSRSSGPSAEGCLFPDTYLLRDRSTRRCSSGASCRTREALAELALEQPRALARLAGELRLELQRRS